MDKISPIKERILQFIEIKRITKEYFCKRTGISYANLRGKSLFSEIGGSQIAEILSNFGEISPEWLLTGKGDMLKFGYKNDEIKVSDVVSEPNNEYKQTTTCQLCKEKDQRINDLKEMISMQKNTIYSLLEQIEPLQKHKDCAEETTSTRTG